MQKKTSWIKAAITISFHIILLWFLLLLIMIFIEKIIMQYIYNSTLRTIIGLFFYGLWLYILYKLPQKYLYSR